LGEDIDSLETSDPKIADINKRIASLKVMYTKKNDPNIKNKILSLNLQKQRLEAQEARKKVKNINQTNNSKDQQKSQMQNASYELEGELVDERTRYAKETGKKFGGAGRPSEEGGNPQIKKRMEKEPWLKYGGSRQPKKVPGKKPPRAGEPGSGVQDPAHKVAVRRASVERAKEQRIGSRFD
jgi:hypothetical protein